MNISNEMKCAKPYLFQVTVYIIVRNTPKLQGGHSWNCAKCSAELQQWWRVKQRGGGAELWEQSNDQRRVETGVETPSVVLSSAALSSSFLDSCRSE